MVQSNEIVIAAFNQDQWCSLSSSQFYQIVVVWPRVGARVMSFLKCTLFNNNKKTFELTMIGRDVCVRVCAHVCKRSITSGMPFPEEKSAPLFQHIAHH